MKLPHPRILPAVVLVFSVMVLCGFTKLSDIETAIIQKDFKSARDLAQKFIKKSLSSKELNEARYYLGVSELNLFQFNEARAAFNQIMRSTPPGSLYDRAWLGIIDSYGMEENFDLALAESEVFLRNRPDSEFLSIIYLKLGRTNLKLSNWDTAQEYLQKLVREFPNSFEAHTGRQLLEEKHYFTIQVGSFLEQPRAVGLVDELTRNGEYAYVVETKDKDGRTFFRVRVGQFEDLQEARRMRERLSHQGYPTHIYP